MKNIIFKGIVICIMSLALSLGFTAFALADDGFYLGISQVQNSISTSEAYYDSDSLDYNERIFVPTLKSGRGFAITCGMELSDGIFELGYTSSAHVGDYQGDILDTTYNIFDINFKGFIIDSEHFRPYWLAGLSVTSLVVKKGSTYYDYFWDEDGYTDATYSGVGLNIGGGIDIKILPSMSLKGECIYRFVSYTSADGIETARTLDVPFSGNGLSYNVGVNFYF